jgi:polysaccharide biosynthesis protein PslH
MRILWVCPFSPLPANTGIRLREYHLIKQLSHVHDITLFSLLQSHEEKEQIESMRAHCSALAAVLPSGGQPGMTEGRRTATDALLGIIDASPRRFYGDPWPEAAAILRAMVVGGRFDLLLVESLVMCNYLWEILPTARMKTILVEHNVETDIQRQHYLATKPGLRRLRKWLYFRTFKAFEQAAARRFDQLIAVSDRDRERLVAMVPDRADAIAVVPSGVDVSAKRMDPVTSRQPNSMIYTGSVTYDANLDAVTYFISDVLPLVRAREPQAELRVTGGVGQIDLGPLKAHAGVTFTGQLPSIDQTVREHSVAIVPLRRGGGTRLKILETMALGTPIVSTSLGADGLDLQTGRDILIADTPTEFAEAVLRLFGDAHLRKQIAASARAVVESKYDWVIAGRALLGVIERLTSNEARDASGAGEAGRRG